MTARRAGAIAALLVLTPLPALAQDASYRALMTPLLATSETVFGQPLVYPPGTPKITASIITLPPGGQTGWHIHTVPQFAYMLEGELTVDYGPKGVKVYKPGDSLIEAVDTPHNGSNKGTVPVRLISVYTGADGVALATPVDQPK